MKISRRELDKKLRAMGFVLFSQNKHIKYKSPGGKSLTISISPYCPYAYTHAIKEAERIIREERR